MTGTDTAYRKVAAEGASGIGLLIALFDTLAGNLRKAAVAQRSNNFETRCREMAHAFMVIGYLESGLRESPGGELADQLTFFYAALRARLIEAQVKQSADILEQEMAKVLKLRGNWQQVEVNRADSVPEILPPASSPVHAVAAPAQTGNRYGGWSA
jgi:flagellar secretion chaperone FliS